MLPVLAAAAILAQAPAPAQTTPPAQDITGQLYLVSPRTEDSGGECFGTGGLRDVRGELPVVVKDGSGKILAMTRTSAGKRPESKYRAVTCIFSFTVPNVPKADFYQIEVGRRGVSVYSVADLIAADWKVAFLLSVPR